MKAKAYDIVKAARGSSRLQLSDYIAGMAHDFLELHGDRCSGDDQAMLTGFGSIGDGSTRVMIVGTAKGKTTTEKIARSFGCPKPEGYRKALIKMKLAEKFNIPIITLIDTPGAWAGVEAEERGQTRAIATNLFEMSKLAVPIVCVVIGEGGSGGALGIGVGDRLAMLENAYLSVVSPEACAAILKCGAEEAAESLRLTAHDSFKLGMVDCIVSEAGDAVRNVREYVLKALRRLRTYSTTELLNKRYEKLRSLGRIAYNA